MTHILTAPSFSSNVQPSQLFLYSHRVSLRNHRTKSVSIFKIERKILPFSSLVEYFRVTRNVRRLANPVCKKMEDGFYMRRCVELAKKAIGCTSPNPMVGCVIVKDGDIVGEGFHPKAGQPHAEVFALRDAGNLAENATAYVSLEPCNHYGRTPPCTEALINAKVKQVIVGMVDPNPIVASKGMERLKASGIDVVVGVEEKLCQKLNEAYIHRMHTGKPFVTLRYSLSLNGRMLSHPGKGAEEPGGYYSKMLQEYDGIVVSGELLSRTSTLPISLEAGANQPFHIIIAKNLFSLDLPITTINSAAPVIVFADKRIRVEPRSEKVETVLLEQITLTSVLDYCGCRGLCSLVIDVREAKGSVTELLEGGLEEGLVQKVMVELCPVWIGSSEASVPSFGLELRKLKDLQSNVANESTLVEGYLS
ncbi:hypothetical protein KFK09_002784 [Dendrobium nobile]|uniref:Riboflavin biosynthesis protein PYRD, chloroplastic n=1 Tax=Dendrobium nobile TaxID=94219 RepID=A0A8T3C5V4_DENNO|nr:hypothetical protein KFK09_002782 [Dendrobium nobile]KAI0527185.1 hypothetical protein KFK09_002784 [Dendrobium nobile]